MEPRGFLGQRRGAGSGGEQDGHHRRAQRRVRPPAGRRPQLRQQGATYSWGGGIGVGSGKETRPACLFCGEGRAGGHVSLD